MSEPSLKIAPTTNVLASCSPHLMPFHISYTGAAPIATFFRVHNSPSTLPQDASPDLASKPSMKKRLLATFRGREMHGLEMPIPTGYGGIVLRSKGPETSNSPASRVQKKSDSQKKGGRHSLRNLRGAKAVVEIDEDVKEEIASLVPEDSFDGRREELNTAPVKRLTPSHVFSSMVIWNSDFAVDEGREEYIQSLDEWITLGTEVKDFFLLVLSDGLRFPAMQLHLAEE